MNIVGHQKNRDELEKLSKKLYLPQSYLFTGPRGVGKKLVALEFSEKVIGVSDKEILTHPDLMILGPFHEIEKGGIKKKRLSIGEIRRGTLFLSRYPTLGKKRVLIIDEAEELTTEASNALLKILEEPNESSILILITHRPGALLPTLLSRLITFSFQGVTSDEMKNYFGEPGEKLPDFFYSLGMPGLIERAIQGEGTFQEHKKRLGKLFQISALSHRERLLLAEELSHDEEELPLLLEEWIIGMHGRLDQEEDRFQKTKLLLLFDRLTRKIGALSRREGNTRLLLEEMFLLL